MLRIVVVRAAVAIVGGVGRHLVKPAAPVLVVLVVMEAGSVRSPRTSAIDRLSTSALSPLLIHVVEGTVVSAMCREHRNLVVAVASVLVILAVVLARAVRVPRALAIHRLGASPRRALLVVMSVGTSVATVRSSRADLVVPASLVLVVASVVVARTIGSPGTHAVDGLSATTLVPLFSQVTVRASVSVVGGIGDHPVRAEALVLVLLPVVGARSPVLPRTHAIDRLRASSSRASLVVVRMRTSVAIVCGVCGNLVVPAPLVLVVSSIVIARAVRAPKTHTIGGLSTASVGALVVVVSVRASVAVVRSTLAVHVLPATLVLVVSTVVVARAIGAPRADAIHGLRAAPVRALVVVVRVGAPVTVVGGVLGDLVTPATLVLVVSTVVVARAIRVPGTDAIHRLRASSRRALLVPIGMGATIAVVGRVLGHVVSPAPPILMITRGVRARSVGSPRTSAVNRLRAAALGALLVVVRERAPNTVVCSIGRDLVASAPLVLVLGGVVAAAVAAPSTNAIHRLCAPRRRAAIMVVRIRASVASVCRILAHVVLPATPVGAARLVAGAIAAPATRAVDGLRAPTVRALRLAITVAAPVTVVRRVLRHGVRPATLVLVLAIHVVARAVTAPRANAMHGLGASPGGALLIVVRKRTSITVVRGRLDDLVVAAPSVRAARLVAATPRSPLAHAIDGLRATARGALLVVVRVRATIPVMGGVLAVHVLPATLVLVVAIVVVARAVTAPRANAVHRLAAPAGGAARLSVAVRAAFAAVSRRGRDHIRPATPGLVATRDVEARAIPAPRTDAVSRLRAARRRALLEVVRVWATRTAIGRVFRNPVIAALGVRLQLPVVCVVVVIVTAAGARAVAGPVASAVDGLGASGGRAVGLGTGTLQAPALVILLPLQGAACLGLLGFTELAGRRRFDLGDRLQLALDAAIHHLLRSRPATLVHAALLAAASVGTPTPLARTHRGRSLLRRSSVTPNGRAIRRKAHHRRRRRPRVREGEPPPVVTHPVHRVRKRTRSLVVVVAIVDTILAQDGVVDGGSEAHVLPVRLIVAQGRALIGGRLLRVGVIRRCVGVVRQVEPRKDDLFNDRPPALPEQVAVAAIAAKVAPVAEVLARRRRGGVGAKHHHREGAREGKPPARAPRRRAIGALAHASPASNHSRLFAVNGACHQSSSL